jgi:signal transduction histidine kinase
MADTLGAQAIGAMANVASSDEAPARATLSSKRVAISLGVAMLVCVLVVAAVSLSRAGGPVAALWPALGVAVVGWLQGPRSKEFDAAYFLFIVLAYAIGNVLVGNSVSQIVLFTVCNALEVVLAVLLIRRFTPKTDLSSVKVLIRFMLVAPVLAPLPAALLSASVIASQGWGAFLWSFSTWWFGHALGLAVVAPFGLSLTRAKLLPYLNLAKAAEAAFILGGVALVCVFVFFLADKMLGFLVTPILLLAAVRLRMLGASAAVLIFAGVSMYAVLSGYGTMAMLHLPVPDKVRIIQLYCIFGALPMLPIAALLDERDGLAVVARAGQIKAEMASAGKSRLLANVSHEIKSPVAGIIGIGELWAGGKLGPVTATQEEMAEMLVRTARQVEALAYDLLDVAHAEAGSVAVKLQAVDLAAVVEDVRRSIAVKPEAAGLRWVVEGRGEKVAAMADSVRLVQIVTNLVTNAVKYGASGGVVILRLSRPSVDRVRLEVADKGPGIALAKQAELFEPFNRLGMEKTTVEGHGIGLALAKRLAELQDGAMGFESTVGEGACFWVELPAAA